MDLDDRVGVVTGPAKGMGAAITLALAEPGADLVFAGRDTVAIEPAAAAVRDHGCRAVVAAFGSRIDLLVSVAGGSGPSGNPFWENTLVEFEQVTR